MHLGVTLNTMFTSALPVGVAYFLAWLFKAGPADLPLWVLGLAAVACLYAAHNSKQGWPPKEREDIFFIPEISRMFIVAAATAYILGAYPYLGQSQTQLEMRLLLLLVALLTLLAAYAKSQAFR